MSVRIRRRGSRRSVANALKWWDRYGIHSDRLRHVRGCGHDNCADAGCTFFCRGCERWTTFEDGGGEAGVAGFLCAPCSNTHAAMVSVP
jgi:hypothetical protein